jgi:hypothetical protein
MSFCLGSTIRRGTFKYAGAEVEAESRARIESVFRSSLVFLRRASLPNVCKSSFDAIAITPSRSRAFNTIEVT